MSNNGNTSDQSSDDLSESPVDERTADPREINDPPLNVVIAYQQDHRREMVSTAYFSFLVLLYFVVICRCWPFLVFACVTYQLVTYDNSYSSRPDCCSWMHDANEEGRLASPTEDKEDNRIRLSDSVEISPVEPLAVENTQAHDPSVLVNPNNAQQAITTTINEVAIPNTHNEANVQITTDEDRTSQIVIDDPTYNINPLNAIESQDEPRSSGNSDEESDGITSSDSGADGDDESNPADDVEQIGQASPTTISNPCAPVQNSVGSNQTNLVDDQLNGQVMETIGRINVPMESARSARAPFFCLTSTLITKTRNRAYSSGESSDEQAV